MLKTIASDDGNVNIPSSVRINNSTPNYADEQARARLRKYVASLQVEKFDPPPIDQKITGLYLDAETRARMDAHMPKKVARPKRARGRVATIADVRKLARQKSRVNRNLFERIEALEDAVAELAAEVRA